MQGLYTKIVYSSKFPFLSTLQSAL